jgi:hypothetical protein
VGLPFRGEMEKTGFDAPRRRRGRASPALHCRTAASSRKLCGIPCRSYGLDRVSITRARRDPDGVPVPRLRLGTADGAGKTSLSILPGSHQAPLLGLPKNAPPSTCSPPFTPARRFGLPSLGPDDDLAVAAKLPSTAPSSLRFGRSLPSFRSRSASAVSHRPDGFLRVERRGFVAPRCRSWGSSGFRLSSQSLRIELGRPRGLPVCSATFSVHP